MKMMSNTNITSIIGVTLMFAATTLSVFLPPPIDMARYPLIGPLVCDVFCVWNSLVKIDRPNSLPTLLMR